MKTFSRKKESTITVAKDRKVLKAATASLTSTIYENLFLKSIKYGFFPRCGSVVQRYGIIAPQPGIEPAPPALEGKVLTTGPPGKS